MKQIVSIKYKVSVKIGIAVFCVDIVQKVVKSITLTNLFFIETFKHLSAGVARYIRRAVSAIVSNNKNIHKFLRVSLCFYTIDKVCDDRFFISCRD